MKKFFSAVMAFVISLSALCPVAYAGGSDDYRLDISKNNVSHDVSPTLYGASIEDISNSCDGGLVSNLVNNNSFEYPNKSDFAWSFDNVNVKTENKTPMNSNNTTYQAITVDGKGVVRNLGYTEIYDGSQKHYNKDKSLKADMPFKKDARYDFGCYLRNVDFEGTISVYLDSPTNAHRVNQLNTSGLGDKKWSYLYTTLTSVANEDGSLAIEFDGEGTILLDFVTLVSEDSYGYGNENWKYTTIRPDLYTALENLSPSYLRFYPNGLSKDGSLDNLYNWKDTIGPVENRKQNESIYSDFQKGLYYNNSNFMGVHEYFQLSKDLGAEPIMVVNVGMLPENQSNYTLCKDALAKLNMDEEQWETYLTSEREIDSGEIKEYTEKVEALGIKNKADYDSYIAKIALTPGTDEFANYAQNVLDLIEYANADSKTSYWGALRGSNGSDEPFGVEYIALGDDNWGDIYLRNFEALYNIIKEKYPDIKIIACAGEGKDDTTNQTYKTISSKFRDVIIDEHSYSENDGLYESNLKYDSYDRQGASIMLGGYNVLSTGRDTDISNNNLASAIEEASYMTALERNSDVVKFSSYSPTMAKINAQDYKSNLLWFDSQKVVFTPSYFVQMLFSNNVGTKYIDTQKMSDSIYQSVTIDDDKQILYIKLVNNGGKEKISVNLNDFGNIYSVSNISFSNNYSSAYNKLNSNHIMPNYNENSVELNSNSFDVTLNKNSVNVIRVAFGENSASHFYEVPLDIDYDTSRYVPQDLKITFVSIVVVAIILAIGISIFVRKYDISKKKSK